MSTSWSDTFAGRTVSSNTTGSWGTASDGETWTAYGATGTNNNYAVASGEGTFSLTAGTPSIIQRLGSTTSADMEVSCRISPGATNDSIYVFARITDSTHYYRLDFTGTSLQIGMKNGGSFTSIKSVSVGLTLTVGTFYWLRFRAIGTSLYGKVWQDGSSEPTSWTVTGTDSNVVTGGVGCGANPHSTTNSTQWDTFNAFTFDVSLSDAVSFDDNAFSVTANPSPIDSNSLLDSITKTGAFTPSDSLSTSDVLTSKSSSSTTDSISLADSQSPTATFTRTDSINNNNVYQSTVLADTPIIYYRLNDSAGTIAHDSSGNGQDGTIGSGVTLLQPGGITGDIDTAMAFSGSGSSQITIPQTNLPTGGSQWSVECWCMRPSYPASGGYNFALAFGTYSPHEMANIGFHWTSATVGHSILSTYSGDIEGSAIAPGVWYHIVGTFDGTNINLYTNGFLTAHTAEVPNIVLAFANVGAGQATDRFTGSIDEAAIYNYALTATQVANHYNAGSNFTYETIAITDATTTTDTNSAVEATTATSSSAMTESSLSSSDSFSDTSKINQTDQFNTTQNVTLWYLSSTTTTLPTATGLANVTGGSLGPQALTTLGTATGFGELHSQTYAGAWPALGAIGTPSGNGYLFDSTMLEGMTLLARTQSPSLFLNCFPGTEPITADIYMRLFKYNGGTYGLIATGLLSGQTISTGGGYAIPTTWAATAFGVGDKLYIDTWINVLTNTNSDATLKVVMQGRSSSGLGVSGQNAYGQLQFQVGPDLLALTEALTLSDMITFDDSAFSDTSLAKPTDAGNLSDAISKTSALTLSETAITSYAATVLGDTPLMYYRLNETNGNTAYDFTSNGRNGTIANGVTLNQSGGLYDDPDAAMLFVRSNTGHITLPQAGLPTGSAQWSIEGWCMVSALPTTGINYMIVGFGTYGPPTHEMAVIGIHGLSASTAQFLLTTYSGDVGGPATVTVGEWYHVIGTFDGTKINLYVNGALVASTTETPNIVLTFANIGAGQNTDYYNGTIDEVAIYNYALSAAQITTHYQVGSSDRTDVLSLTEIATHTNTPLNPLDALATTESEMLTDSGNIIEASLLTDNSSVTDNASMTDSITKIGSPSLIDAGNLSDTSSKITESAIQTDNNSFADTASNVDIYSRSNHLGSSYAATIMGDKPMAYYRLDEANGPTAYDQANNQNATYKATGVTYSQVGALAGDTDTSVLLDGATGKITCPTSLSTTGLSSLSVECWFNLATTSYSGLPRLINNDFASSTKNGFELLLGSGSSGGLFYVGNGISESGAGIGSFTYNANIWYHIVGTWDGTTIRIYVNGVQKGTSPLSGTMSAAAHAITLGTAAAYTGDFLNGNIDEVAIYPYTLSSVQITNHYTTGTSYQNETITLAELETFLDVSSLDDSKSNLLTSEIQVDVPAPLTEASMTNSSMTSGIVLWSDTFSGRTVATNTSGNWGIASNGETWSCLQGGSSPGTFSVTNGEGTISEATGSNVVIMRLGQKSAADTEVLCRISPGVSNDSIYVFTRLVDSTHYYRMDFTGTSLQIAKKAGGGFTSLASVGTGLTSTPGTFCWLRFRVVGTSLFGKVWIDGTSEPQSWLVTTTDSSNATGGVGVGANPQSTTNVQYDSFSAYTVIPADATFVDFLSMSENVTPTDFSSFMDSIKVIDVNSARLLFAIATCRDGSVTTSSRGN